MLSAKKLDNLIKTSGTNVTDLAEKIARTGLEKKQAATALRNWRKGLYSPIPRKADVEAIAQALGVQATDISEWRCTVKYAPSTPRKASLVTQLIMGRGAQEALDLLKFTHKRASYMIDKALKSAIANADEDSADVESLYVSEARVDGAGVRVGTKRFIAKDRGRAHSLLKLASHIHITVTEAK
ncbi:MAG TPA: 50S ribosomal protein L22 [Phycisphaerales bacterium]|nr:50S ribosomal protein L22 [Phycisphaerales bacterium]